ncbi:hypothetical protein B296_00046431 [Ensete ventricosum]|uniref:Uncharacterized protein n=1 Tax=Ensete ventricosum TaxID=4639 RepID=A0A426YS66_ENSVE|nr:hypothetical protein B296_00046431 [Ensete ventricosum]
MDGAVRSLATLSAPIVSFVSTARNLGRGINLIPARIAIFPDNPISTRRSQSERRERLQGHEDISIATP